MPPPPLRHRCFNHGDRVAVARCAGCGRHFCRECVAEHDGRMICGTCLRRGETPGRDARQWLAAGGRLARTLLAVFVVWLWFYWGGLLLLRIPAEVHEGSMWDEDWWKEEAKP